MELHLLSSIKVFCRLLQYRCLTSPKNSTSTDVSRNYYLCVTYKTHCLVFLKNDAYVIIIKSVHRHIIYDQESILHLMPEPKYEMNSEFTFVNLMWYSRSHTQYKKHVCGGSPEWAMTNLHWLCLEICKELIDWLIDGIQSNCWKGFPVINQNVTLQSQ